MKERYVLTAGAVAITLTESEEQAFQEELGRMEPEAQRHGSRLCRLLPVGCRQGLSRGDARELRKGFALVK
ncbi:MAG TPA: hypothetical protein VIQ31_05655, partial [Phormidium sp.]